jgi:hypothetical protein
MSKLGTTMSDNKKRLYISGVKHNTQSDIIETLARHLELPDNEIEVRQHGTTAIAEFPGAADDQDRLDEALYQLRRQGLLAQIFHR